MSSPAAPLAPRQCSGLPVQLSSSQHGANANISDFGEGRRSYGAVQGCPRQFSSCKACLDQQLATTLQIEAMQQLCRMQHW